MSDKVKNEASTQATEPIEHPQGVMEEQGASIGKGTPLLELSGLRTWFFTSQGIAPSVDDVSFDVHRGETVCIVGESGCGKSVTALSLMQLVPSPPGRIVEGSARFDGKELFELSNKEMRGIRGNDISMIFQEPMSSLNPVYTVGDQIGESARLHLGASRREAREIAVRMLSKVGIADAESRVDAYPHELSGGMKQRVMIAMALTCDPIMLIADEPTTALDVTIQAQILELMAELQRDRGMSVLLITHDLGVVAEVADRVIVMYAGTVVEEADVITLFEHRAHPYTRGLFSSLPAVSEVRGGRLTTVEGIVPGPHAFPSGCRFRSRCPFAEERCAQERPALREIHDGHKVACHFAEEVAHGTKNRTGPLMDSRVVRKRERSSGEFVEEVVDRA